MTRLRPIHALLLVLHAVLVAGCRCPRRCRPPLGKPSILTSVQRRTEPRPGTGPAASRLSAREVDEEDTFAPDGPIPVIGSGEGWTAELLDIACRILDDHGVPYAGASDLGLVWVGVRQSDRQRAHALLAADERLSPFLIAPDTPPER